MVGIRANVLLEWISVGQFRSVREVAKLLPEQYFFTEADIKRLLAAVAASVSSMRAASGPKMLTWSPKPDDGPYYCIEKLATAWGLSARIVRRMFKNESGVLKPTSGDPKQIGNRAALRIPPEVVLRVWHRLCG